MAARMSTSRSLSEAEKFRHVTTVSVPTTSQRHNVSTPGCGLTKAASFVHLKLLSELDYLDNGIPAASIKVTTLWLECVHQVLDADRLVGLVP